MCSGGGFRGVGAGLGATQSLGATTEGCRLGPINGQEKGGDWQEPTADKEVVFEGWVWGCFYQDPPNSVEGEEHEDVAPTSGRKDSGLGAMLKYGMSSEDPLRNAKREGNEAKAQTLESPERKHVETHTQDPFQGLSLGLQPSSPLCAQALLQGTDPGGKEHPLSSYPAWVLATSLYHFAG